MVDLGFRREDGSGERNKILVIRVNYHIFTTWTIRLRSSCNLLQMMKKNYNFP